MILFRPVGLEELRAIFEARMRAFPPRLPDQPIFYPVTNESYATEIARDWNTKAGTKAGFVTKFSVDDDYASKFERRIVGAKEHEELWVPAEELATLNAHIGGVIEIIGAFFGDDYRGHVSDEPGLREKTAREQLLALVNERDAPTTDHLAVFLNFFFWEAADFSAEGIDAARRDEALSKLKSQWADGAYGDVSLGARRTTATATSSG